MCFAICVCYDLRKHIETSLRFFPPLALPILGSPGWWATAFLESNKPKKKWYWQDVIYWVWHSGCLFTPGWLGIQEIFTTNPRGRAQARPKMSWWRQRMRGMRPLPLSRLRLLPFKKSGVIFWWWLDWILEYLLICSYIIWLVFLLFLSRLVCGCGWVST